MKRAKRVGLLGVVLAWGCAVAAVGAPHGQPDVAWCGAPAGGGARLHLLILSGQSNMVGLRPDTSFIPTLTNALPRDTFVVVQDASSGKSIENWYREPSAKEPGGRRGALYARLLAKVHAAMTNARPDTATFVWMQGEADTHPKVVLDYRSSLAGLVAFLRADLGREDVGVVIGRISDFGNSNTNRPGWNKVRDVQVAYAEADPLAVWVDTDDLNGVHDDLHYTRDGYAKLGQRFAEKVIELITQPAAGAP